VAEYPFTDAGLRDALARLGRRRQKVRRTLVKHGCQGDPDQCNSCPVAVYVERVFGADVAVTVEDFVTVTRDLFVDEGHGRYYEATQQIRAEAPDAVLDFIESMDGRQYPELIKMHPKEPA
jgi:hypothetical protein